MIPYRHQGIILHLQTSHLHLELLFESVIPLLHLIKQFLDEDIGDIELCLVVVHPELLLDPN